jgi:homocysteine S-methyltransferase
VSAREALRPAGNPVAPFLARQGAMILDGGLATSLEELGCDLNDPLWSAKILLEAPDLISRVHRSFLEAGADCIATATYQATFEGLARRGLHADAAEGVLRCAVRLAVVARDDFWAERGPTDDRPLRPLVAASIGPYGAYLADGSEYTGDYGLDEDQLRRFHARRWRVLAESDADVLACETIPSAPETRVLLSLLEDTPNRWAWLSFSCSDAGHISDGTPIADVVRLCDAAPRVAAVGVNCIAPALVSPLLDRIRAASSKPLVVYPNSGERYDAETKRWAEGTADEDWTTASLEWREKGARVIGGCCRTRVAHVARLREIHAPRSTGARAGGP